MVHNHAWLCTKQRRESIRQGLTRRDTAETIHITNYRLLARFPFYWWNDVFTIIDYVQAEWKNRQRKNQISSLGFALCYDLQFFLTNIMFPLECISYRIHHFFYDVLATLVVWIFTPINQLVLGCFCISCYVTMLTNFYISIYLVYKCQINKYTHINWSQFHCKLHTNLKKITAIRRTAFHESDVSRHHVGLIEGHPETPQTSQHHGIEGSHEPLGQPISVDLTHLCRPVRSTFAVRETASLGIMGQSLGQQMLNAPVGINGLTWTKSWFVYVQGVRPVFVQPVFVQSFLSNPFRPIIT